MMINEFTVGGKKLSDGISTPEIEYPYLPPETPSDANRDFYTSLMENIEELGASLNNKQEIYICYTGRSGGSISIETIEFHPYSGLTILRGIGLVDNEECIVFCHIREAELVVKVSTKESDEEKRPLGFQRAVIKE